MAQVTPAVLLLDLPEKALAGVDLLSFTTTPKFQGVRDLPPGWHFIFTSTNSALSVRHGVWFHVKAPYQDPQIFVKKWNRAAEQLVEEHDPSEILRWKANLGQIWRDRLTPYRQHVPSSAQHSTSDRASEHATAAEEELQESESGDWLKLTSNISPQLLTRITGQHPDHWTLTTASSAARDLDHIPGLSNEDTEEHAEKELKFLPVDLKRTWRPDATGRERTDAARDRSWALNDLVSRYCSAEQGILEVLGEIQFCFLMILTLNNYSCLEQWRRLLQLLFTCVRAVEQYPDFFTSFISALKLQLQHCQDVDGGLIDISDQGATLLKSSLRQFRRGLEDVSGMGKARVVDELDDLEDFLRSQHGWQLDSAYVKHGLLELEDGERVEMDFGDDDEDDETGEYAPVIVEMPGEADADHGTSNSLQAQVPGGVGREQEESDPEEDDTDLDAMDARY